MLKTIKNLLRHKASSAGDFELSPAIKPIDSLHKELLRKLNFYVDRDPEFLVRYQGEINYLNMLPDNMTNEEKLLYSILPYDFTKEYDTDDIKVYRDEGAQMYYVLLEGKKLYYPKSFISEDAVRRSFMYLQIEQDTRSPHRYLGKSFAIDNDDVVLDLGAAEGNFSLLVVEKAKEVILVESNPEWIEALEKTFSPWQNKVTIINKYAGSITSAVTTTISEVAKSHPITAIKMDIEGAEFDVLSGGSVYLVNNKLKLAVTTYHKHDDAANINLLLESYGYTTSYSPNYMLFIYDLLKPPYFRKALIFGSKKGTASIQ